MVPNSGCYFFFQAEDGIRDDLVNGVQTCALPISATAYGYSASVLGPVVRVHNGDNVEMTIDNGLDCHTTVHWHGLSVPGNLDGGPHQIIEPGGEIGRASCRERMWRAGGREG